MREWELHLGDALQVLPGMPDGSVDAVVCDPPAGISFMGAGWDNFDRGLSDKCGRRRGNGGNPLAGVDRRGRAAFIAFLTPIMAQCLRVLKPGGYALVWALPRTSHWTATALEDAGFEIRDVITHLFGQGFPKGKGCLKPAAEHWVLCRRPGPRVLPLNIEECRIGTGGEVPAFHRPHLGNGIQPGSLNPSRRTGDSSVVGRYPANLCLSHHESCVCRGTKRVRSNGRPNCKGKLYRDDRQVFSSSPPRPYASVGDPDGTEEVEDWCCVESCPVRLLDEQAGYLHARGNKGPSPGGGGLFGLPPCHGDFGPGDAGNASRFFYVAKADRADRGEGNDHATVKPTALMSWLVKLVSRPGETVLDPFAGSGSTGVAALRCERRFVGIERDAHYHAIALKRLAAVDGPLFAAPAGEAAP